MTLQTDARLPEICFPRAAEVSARWDELEQLRFTEDRYVYCGPGVAGLADDTPVALYRYEGTA